MNFSDNKLFYFFQIIISTCYAWAQFGESKLKFVGGSLQIIPLEIDNRIYLGGSL